MRVPITWLRDYVQFDASPAELADRLTFSGLEIEEIDTIGVDCRGMVVGEVLSVGPHPDADDLQLCRLSAGRDTVQVVCGAHNFGPSDKVPLALPGSTLADGTLIRKGSIRGQASDGVLCAEDELGLSDDHSGLLLLPRDIPAGTPLAEILGSPEPVLVIEVTPNRPDCLSMIGIAREVAALYGKKLKLPGIAYPRGKKPIAEMAKVEVKDPALCPRYTARAILGATVDHGPLWMRLRLLQAGIRAINNIVDITNYVLLECGQPLHAFDRRFLSDNTIIVRRAKKNEKMSTLDDLERALSPEMLVIADSNKPVALAGVMGGAGSEIRDDTTEVLLESACFNPTNIRRTSATLGLSTESSYRFERGLDPNLADWGSKRATSLLIELAGATAAAGSIDVYAGKPRKKTITCRFSNVRDLLGVELADSRIRSILKSLELQVTPGKTKDSCSVSIPTFRLDLEIEADLIEEIARIHGLDNLPLHAPRGLLVPGADDSPVRAVYSCKSMLAGLGLTEIMNYSLVSERILDLFDARAAATRIVLPNPISMDQSVLRPSLIPQMVSSLGHNLSRQIDEAALFEMGRVYRKTKAGKLEEAEHLAIGLMGNIGRSPLDKRRALTPEDSFLWLKGMLCSLCTRLGIGNPVLEQADLSWAEPGTAVKIAISDSAKPVEVGFAGLLSKAIGKEWRMNQPVALLEVDVLPLVKHVFDVPAARMLPIYPSIQRDMAIIVPKLTKNEEVMTIIKKNSPLELTAVAPFDIYEHEGIGAGKKSLAYAFTYRAPDHTLTDEEANRLHSVIRDKVAGELDAEVRER